MARLEAAQATNLLALSTALGTFTEQTGSRMVLVLPGAPEQTLIFTGSFSYEDPNPNFDPDDLPDDLDIGDFDPGSFDDLLPDDIRDLLDEFDGLLPDEDQFAQFDIWGTVTGIELLTNGSTVWTATELSIPLGDGENELSVINKLELLTSGFSGADAVNGSSFEDVLNGFAGDDSLTGGAADDFLNGGEGKDMAIFSGSQASYTLNLSTSFFEITDRRADGNGKDTLVDIEILNFDTEVFDFLDPDVGLDLTQFAGPANLTADQFESFIELYIALFNRSPDAIGLNFWGTAFANGTSLRQMTELFFEQPETKALYPDNFSNAQFVETVYNNVLGRPFDQDGFDFWVPVLDDTSNGIGRDTFIFEFLAGVQEGTPDEVYLQNKVDIGAYFAVHKGMSDTANAASVMQLFDGTVDSIDDAVAAIDAFHTAALDPDTGEFLMPLAGVLPDPFPFS